MKNSNRWTVGFGVSLSLVFSALVAPAVAAENGLEDWIQFQTGKALSHLYDAISPSDGARGAVMASPSRANPDYYAYWVRDGSLVMREIFEARGANNRRAMDTLKDWAIFSRRNQLTENRSTREFDRQIGEPKFLIDGTEFNKGWGRPQNDGPALRALVLMDFADELIRKGDRSFVNQYLYRAEMPAQTVIKADLEYTAAYWREINVDLWEEVRGDHFYTRIAQWRALEEGSMFAKAMGDEKAGAYYKKQADLALRSLDDFWSNKANHILTTLRAEDNRGKDSNLDIAAILGVLHSGKQGAPFFVNDPRVIATAYALEQAFGRIYKINGVTQDRDGRPMAPGLGRYEEDVYDGNGTTRGNPWFLATQGMAEYLLRLRGELKRTGTIVVNDQTRAFYEDLVSRDLPAKRRFTRADPDFNAVLKALKNKSDSYIRRARYHTANNGHQSEQFNRDTGFMQGARDLTWSYASFLSLRRIRDRFYD